MKQTTARKKPMTFKAKSGKFEANPEHLDVYKYCRKHVFTTQTISKATRYRKAKTSLKDAIDKTYSDYLSKYY